MNIHNTMHWILAWTALSLSQITVNGVPYGSINDLYDTNYEYEFGDNQVREEVFITKTPQFLSHPQEIVVNEGQTVRLPCLVDRLEGFVLLWRKNEQIISVGHQILDRSESRIHLEEVENGNTLVISLADRADEAEYVCSVSAYRKTEIRHNVRIRVKPVITTSPEEPLTLSEGDSATLSCQLLSGTPIPDLKWRRCEGESFPTGVKEILEDVIKLESVTRDDSGCYVCQADNGFADAPVTSLAMLVVEYPPTVHIQKTEDSAEEIKITCTVESQPAAEVTWLKEGEKIEDDTKNIFINKSDKNHTLTLLDAGTYTFSTYTCLAENKLGSDESSLKISGQEVVNVEYGNEMDNFKDPLHSEHEVQKLMKIDTNYHEIQEAEDERKFSNKQPSSVGEIYFAQTPSFYTFPDTSNKLEMRKQLIKHSPKSFIDFLKLLRIYQHSVLTKEDVRAFSELKFESIPNNHLLRSPHAYGSNLREGLKSVNIKEIENKKESSKEDAVTPEPNIKQYAENEKQQLETVTDDTLEEVGSRDKMEEFYAPEPNIKQYAENEEKREETLTDNILDEVGSGGENEELFEEAGSGDEEEEFYATESIIKQYAENEEKREDNITDETFKEVGSGDKKEEFDATEANIKQYAENEEKRENNITDEMFEEVESGDKKEEFYATEPNIKQYADNEEKREETVTDDILDEVGSGDKKKNFYAIEPNIKQYAENEEKREETVTDDTLEEVGSGDKNEEFDATEPNSKQYTENKENREETVTDEEEEVGSGDEKENQKIKLHEETQDTYFAVNRFLHEKDIGDFFIDEVNDLSKEKSIPILRGQHLFKTNLKEFDYKVLQKVEIVSKEVDQPTAISKSIEAEADMEEKHILYDENNIIHEIDKEYTPILKQYDGKSKETNRLDNKYSIELKETIADNDEDDISDTNNMKSSSQLQEDKPDHLFPAVRYLNEKEISDLEDDEIDYLNLEKQIPVFRGQHLFKTDLEEFDPEHEKYREEGSGEQSEVLKPSESFKAFEEEKIKLYSEHLKSDFKNSIENGDSNMVKQYDDKSKEADSPDINDQTNADDKESKFQLHDLTKHENTKQDNFKTVRYLHENEILDLADDEKDDLDQEKAILFFRGQHLVETDLEGFNSKDEKYHVEDFREFKESVESEEIEEFEESYESEQTDDNHGLETETSSSTGESLTKVLVPKKEDKAIEGKETLAHDKWEDREKNDENDKTNADNKESKFELHDLTKHGNTKQDDFSTVRYLHENEILNLADDEKDDLDQEKTILVFRGQHLVETDLEDLNSKDEKYHVDDFRELKESVESEELEEFEESYESEQTDANHALETSSSTDELLTKVLAPKKEDKEIEGKESLNIDIDFRELKESVESEEIEEFEELYESEQTAEFKKTHGLETETSSSTGESLTNVLVPKKEANFDMDNAILYPKEVKEMEKMYFTNGHGHQHEKEVINEDENPITGVQNIIKDLKDENEKGSADSQKIQENEIIPNIEFEDKNPITGHQNIIKDLKDKDSSTEFQQIPNNEIIPLTSLFKREKENQMKVIDNKLNIMRKSKNKDRNGGPHPYRFICSHRLCNKN